MEHYKKKQSLFFEEECLPNEMRITATGKAHDLTTRATHRLKEHPVEGVIISASGNHVTKAVTVAELLKRRIPGLLQDTQVKYVRVEDVWEPDIEGLDMLKVTRRIPAISMRLVEGKVAVDAERRVVTDQGEVESDEGRKDALKNRRRGRGAGGEAGGGGGRGAGGGRGREGKWRRGGGEEGEWGRGGGRGGEGSRGMKQRGKGRRRPSGGRGMRDGEDRGAEQETLAAVVKN